MITTLSNFSAAWWSWVAPLSIQVAVLAALVWLIDLALKKRVWPQVRYALWALVFVKLLLPPSFALPTSVSSKIASVVLAAEAPAVPQFGRTGSVDLASPLLPVSRTGGPYTAPVAPAATVSWKAFAFLTWLGGIIAIATYLGLRVFRFWRSIGEAVNAGLPAALDSALKRAAARLRVRAFPRVALTDAVCGAAAFGVFRPILLVPKSAAAGLSAETAEHVFLHEIAHVKRGDLLVNAAQTILFVTFWFNPFVWLGARRLRRLRELCCDATVAASLREDTPRYRHTLLNEARRILMVDKRFGLGLLGLFESPASLAARLEYLTRPVWNHRKLRAITAVLSVVAMFLFVLPMAQVAAAPQKPPAAAETSQPPASAPAAASEETTLTLRGIVLDESGKPAARVSVTAYGRHRDAEITVSGETGPDGRFTIAAPVYRDGHAGYLVIAKTKDTYAIEPAVSDNAAPFNEVSLRLSKADAAITGKVTDAAGKPLAGVKVSISSLSESPKSRMKNKWDRHFFEYTSARDAFVAVTNEKGEFEITTLPRDHVAEVEFSNDTCIERTEFIVGAKPQTVQLVPAGRILARIVSEDPDVKGAGVPLIMNMLDFSRVGGVRRLVTGDDGTVLIDRLEPGKYQVTVNRSEEKALSEVRVTSVTVESGKTVEAKIEVVKGSHITGRIVEKGTGKPFPPGEVQPYFARRTPGGRESMNTGTDDQGYFSALLAPGRYDVSWVRTNREPRKDEFGNLLGDVRSVELKAGEDVDIGVMEVPPSAAPPAPESLGSIKGRVKTAESGLKLAGVPVRAHKFEGKKVFRNTETDAGGGFVLDGLDPGPYQVEVFGSRGQSVVGVESLSVSVAASKTSDAEIEILRGSLVTGRVLDKATGKPVSDREVGISLDRTISETNSIGYMGDLDPAENRYAMRLPPGAYEVYPFYKDKHDLTVFVKSLKRDLVLTSGADVELPDFLISLVDTDQPKPETPGGNFRWE